MSNPILFIDHQGTRILFVDFSNRRADEVEKIARSVPEIVELGTAQFHPAIVRFYGSIF
jgi:hypothetical protein